MRMSFRLAAAVLVLAFAASDGLAGSTGKIAGTARDARTKEALPGVNVVVAGTNLGGSSDIAGRYVILNVPPGRHRVVASFIGYRRFEVNDVSVNVDFTTPLEIELTEGSVELDAVVVQAERSPLIRQDLTNPVASISSDNIEALPVTEISEVIGLQAGVVVDDDGTIHIRGGRANEIAYTVNGVNVNNPYANTRAVGIATNAVQEVSVSSGTFNAEYGQAMSGVVNYVTKEGGARWSGNFRYLTGDYLSSHSDLFTNIDKVNLASVNRMEASFGGPLVPDLLTLFVAGVYNYNQGYLYGQRLYLPQDSYLSREAFPSGDPRVGSPSSPYYFAPLRGTGQDIPTAPLPVPVPDSVGAPRGDGATVPLNPSRSYNFLANAGLKVTPTIRLKYEFIYDFSESPSNSAFANRYKPDGRSFASGESFYNSFQLTHTVSDRMFYEVKGSYITSTGTDRAYDAFDDPRYLPSFYQQYLPNTSFLTGGTDLFRFWQKTETWAAKFDLVAQAFPSHEIKFGMEYRHHTVRAESYTLQFQDTADVTAVPSFNNVLTQGNVFRPYIPTAEGGYVNYARKPQQFAAYLQDKIELFKSLILILGARYEYFDPAAQYNPNLSAELSQQDTIFVQAGLVDAEIKHMLSPRLSVSYPITDQGTIRLSYGHFYQIGSLGSLYRNPTFRAPLGTTPSFGNPNVNPEKSIQYELGLQQGLTEDMKLDVTAFYKDVSNYIYSQRVITARGDREYNVLTNLSYANVRGVTVSLLKRRAPESIFSATLDYTFQVAEGNRTEPTEEVFFNEQMGKLSETYLVPLNWERSHTITTTVTLAQPSDWAVSFIGYLRAGTPYTPGYPSNVVPITFTQNSGNQPVQWNVDVKLEKFFRLGLIDMSVFVQADNLFDVQNELYVYSNSGRALYDITQTLQPYLFDELRTRIARGDPGMIPASAVDNYYANPGNISAPRLVRLGASLIF